MIKLDYYYFCLILRNFAEKFIKSKTTLLYRSNTRILYKLLKIIFNIIINIIKYYIIAEI